MSVALALVGGTADGQGDEKSPTGQDPRHKQALERFKVAAEAEKPQRQRELDDLKFDAGEQWPEAIARQRAGTPGQGIGAVAPRPCLTINKLDAPVLQVLNQQRTAKLGIQVKPKGLGANRDTAEILQGLIRHIESESRANIARGWSFERAAKVGRGVYRVLKTYANDGDFDQDLVIARILNQHCVYLDPFAIEPDWSDGEWAFIVEDIPEARYKRLFPKSQLARMETMDLESIGDSAPEWMRGDEESRVFRIAEYWYVEHTDRTLVVVAPSAQMPMGFQGFEDELPPAPEGTYEIVQSRTVDVRTVQFCKINAIEILEEETWDGRYIPLVPVIGREYNVDGVRSWKGIISNAKDAQRSYNYMRSAQVEAIGLAPRAPFIMAEGQDEGYEEMWATANTINYPALKYRPITIGGVPAPPPQRNVTEPAIQAITLAAAAADNDLKATTGVGDPSLGLMTPSDRSAKAIQALQQQSEHGNSNYLDNLAAISMTLEGRILLDLIPKVYDRPGRIARILGEDETDQTVMLNQPFRQGPGGQPVPMPNGASGPGIKHYDLASGSYTCVVSVGKSYLTRREEGVAMIGDLLTAAPAMAPVISDLWVGDMDFPAAKPIAARLKKMLPPQLQGGDDEGGTPALPPAAQQQLAQQQQQLQQLQQQVQQQQQVIETKRQELEAKAAIAERELQAKMALAQQELASKQHIEEVKAQVALAQTNAKVAADQHKAEVQATLAQIQHLQAMRHEAALTGAQLASSATQAQLDRQHDVATQIHKTASAERVAKTKTRTPRTP